jgi:hypothetical protein
MIGLFLFSKQFFSYRETRLEFAMNQAQHEGGDLLVGRDAIRNFLTQLGMTDADPYYLRRTGRWPISNTAAGAGGGGKLIASKRRLARYIDEITRGRARTSQPHSHAE